MKQPKPKRKTPPVEKLKITIDRLNDDGLGSALHEDKELLVCGAYPGELVEVEILHRGQRRLIGRLLRVLRHSPQRRTSPCHHAADCQGCPLIELQPQQQLEFKRQQVATALRLNGLDDIEVPEVIAAPKNLGYRTTAKLAIGRWRRQATAAEVPRQDAVPGWSGFAQPRPRGGVDGRRVPAAGRPGAAAGRS